MIPVDFSPLVDQITEKIVAKLRVRLPEVQPRLMNARQAGMYIGRSAGAMSKLMARGGVPARKIDGRWYVDRIDLDRWIEEQKTR